ncbi:MAG: lipopolysaccharide heptosyltransferase I [Magnetococcales bacterium]|nr:lipopolysaccharide heptosyltransferase I [Magnetococcales bacterium]
MRVLLVKISAMGDVIHALPAVTDACRQVPGLELDWLVERRFAALPGWHPGVRRVIPVDLKGWKGNPGEAWRSGAVGVFLREVRAERYDRIIDAQGLLKSALLTALARGPTWGPDGTWGRERWALPFYRHRVGTGGADHVIQRLRHLLAAALDYAVPDAPPDFALERRRLPPPPAVAEGAPFVLFLHGAAWPSKQWPESYWLELARWVVRDGRYRVLLPWGSEEERLRAQRLADEAGYGVEALPPLTLSELTGLIPQARAVVGLDSGLAHLTAALGIPCVTLFGATNPDYSGIAGDSQRFLRASYPCAPCMKRGCVHREGTPIQPACYRSLPPETVWEALEDLLAGG